MTFISKQYNMIQNYENTLYLQLNPEPSGTLTDRFGYLCLSCTGGTDNPYGPLPIPPQRLNNEPGYQTVSIK